MPTYYQRDFIDLCVRLGALKFGSFKLKSGRESPYFFNAGLFNTGEAIAAVGRAYAAAVAACDIGFDMLFGPAYKGIPLVTATAAALAEHEGSTCRSPSTAKRPRITAKAAPWSAARSPDRVLIVDDVITAGTAIRESIDIIRAARATPAGVVLALDRQERGHRRAFGGAGGHASNSRSRWSPS